MRHYSIGRDLIEDYCCVALVLCVPLSVLIYCVCRYVIVVEHDLSVLDYLSDYICCLYGAPGCYGVVTMPFSVREGKGKEAEWQFYF